MNCDQIDGVPTTRQTKPSVPHGITFLAGLSAGFPPYVVGPVVEAADEVEIHLADGQIIRTRTFDAPDDLGAIRFYATQVPSQPPLPGGRPQVGVEKLGALTDEGEVVACLVVPLPATGVPLSTCAS
jgi:hypothetical protein